jgi:hypothetical protein
MFVRLLVYVGLLALAYFGLVGCGDEDPIASVETTPEDMVVPAVAELIKTIPASGKGASEYLPVVLYFDKEPRAVTVNGTAARIEGKIAVWCFPNPVEKLGDQLFHIKWTNPDGSSNTGAFIRLIVSSPDVSLPSILAGSVFDGAADVEPDPLNKDGIWYSFDEPVIGVKAKLLTVDGEDLGWEAVWDDRTVKFLPGVNGKLLENGKHYIIQMVVDEAWIYNEFACDCMDCSYFENIDITIRFRTVRK